MNHIEIRPMTSADVTALTGPRLPTWATDYPTEQDTEIGGFLTSGQFQYATATSPWGPWVTTVDGMLVGGAGFHGPPRDCSAEIGYHLCPSHRGRGIATRVVALLADLAQGSGATALVAGTDPDNLPSQQVLQRSGFVRTPDEDGELRWLLRLAT